MSGFLFFTFLISNIIYDMCVLRNRFMKTMWDIKYRPNVIQDYVFQSKDNEIKFKQYIQERSIPNLLLHGHRGTGKSTVARLLIKELIQPENYEFDVKVINASKDNDVDFVRNVISSFISNFPMGDIKIILLEEADYLSRSAQATLRSLTEDYTDSVRFIITCNYPQYLIPELQSRFKQYHFSDMPVDEMMLRVCDILEREHIEPDLAIIDECIARSYPDFRQVLINLQGCVIDNKLTLIKSTNTLQWKETAINHLKNKQWMDLFQLTRTSVPDNEINEFFEWLYNNIQIVYDFDTIQYPQSISIIAEGLYRTINNSLPYIPMSAMILELMSLGRA